MGNIPLDKAIAEIYRRYPYAIDEMFEALVRNRSVENTLGESEFETIVRAAKKEGYRECAEDALNWYRKSL